MKKKTTLYLVQAALIAAMYVALTYLSNMAGLWDFLVFYIKQKKL